MRREIKTQPLTAAGFAPFVDVLGFSGAPDKLINQGLCGRYHDRAIVHHDGTRASVYLMRRASRYRLEMMERHPGITAFLPMTEAVFLVIVAPDEQGLEQPVAFLTEPYMGVNYHANGMVFLRPFLLLDDLL